LNFRLSQKVNIGIKEIPEKRAGQREMAKKHVPNAANILQIFFAGTRWSSWNLFTFNEYNTNFYCYFSWNVSFTYL